MNEYIFLITGLIVGSLVGSLFLKSKYRSYQKDQESLIAEAKTQVEQLKQESLQSARKDADEYRLKLDKSFAEKEKSLSKKQKRLQVQLTASNEQLASLENKLSLLDQQSNELNNREKQINELADDLATTKEALSGLNAEQAKEYVLRQATEKATNHCELIYKKILAEKRNQASEEARDVLLSAMQRYSAECASDRTTTTIYLPNDEMKGRIIGRDGRNIRTLETLTGANIIIDDTPETVVISCFSSYRRELARITLEHLIEDGRIHPNRIHEMVSMVTEQMDRDLERSAVFLCEELNVGQVNPVISRQLGLLKYRFNSFQNLLQQSREVSCLMGLMAAELHMDVLLAKRIGLLHSIGMSFDESSELNSTQLGADFLRREGESDILVKAIENYKDTYTLSCGMDRLLHVAVQISRSRPGAADEAMDSYVNRLLHVENMMNSMDEVADCVVLHAGREVLVSVKPDLISDQDLPNLAREITAKIENDMTIPGAVQVIVSRDFRVEETATP